MTAKRQSIITLGFCLGMATSFGVGFLPMSGTMGSLVAVGLLYVLGPVKDLWLSAFCVLGLGLGVIVAGVAGKYFRVPDASAIVIDEVVGMGMAMIGVPKTGYWLLWAFILFRFFDIVKVPPADWVDAHLKNGWGVMLDDVIAAFYSNIILHAMMASQLVSGKINEVVM